MKTFLKLFVVLFLTLITYNSSLITAFAVSPPNPQPCKNAQDTELINNYVIGEDGKPPIPPLTGYREVSGKDTRQKPEDGPGGDIVILEPKTFSFQVDFSKLQAIFGASNANFLEGNYQDPLHATTNLLDANVEEFNQYNGSAEKTSSVGLTNQLRKKYVDYVYNHPELNESNNKYTDIEDSGNPKTVYDLVTEFGDPKPPKPNATEEQKTAWLDSWGKYWTKLPTAWSEFYKAELRFHYVQGDHDLELAKMEGHSCPPRLANQYVNFVMPEFYRTTAISDQLNRQIVSVAAQSYQNHGTLPGSASAINSIKEAFAYCWKLLTNPPKIVDDLKKAVPISLEFLNPIKTVLAATPNPEPEDPACLRIFKDAKNGQAPYCPLPQEEVSRLGSSVSCGNKDDAYKLQKENPNVVCTFTFTVSIPYQIDKFNSADCHSTGGDNYTCTPKIYIIPNFMIPWLAAIWNNTVDSEKGSGTNQSGRPGIYSFFTPRSVYSSLFPSKYKIALDILEKCYPNWPEETGGDPDACAKLNEIGNVVPCRIDVTLKELAECVSGKITKTLPGQANSQGDKVKQKYLGATDCNKIFVKDIALKPVAMQKSQNIQSQDGCDLSSASNSGGGTDSNPPVDHPGTDNDCSGKYTTGQYPTKYFSETGNFGDPNCDYSESQLLDRLRQLDPSNADYWYLTVVYCESRYNPNIFRHHIEPGEEDTPDPAGAWGLFQMGRGRNHPTYDHGDVPWQDQISNAVRYKNEVNGGSFSYWGCAT